MKQRRTVKLSVIACLILVLGGLLLYLNCVTYNYILPTSTHPDSLRQIGNDVVEKPEMFTADDMQFFMFGDKPNGTVYNARLLEYVRQHISKPSPNRPRHQDASLNFDTSQEGQAKFVDNILQKKTGGFFVECGAGDGVSWSNSLFFEMNRNWTGLLIDANPKFYRNLLRINRNVYATNACLSPTREPSLQMFQSAHVLGGILNQFEASQMEYIKQYKFREADIMVGCFSLNSLISALGVLHVDYLSLDIEGAELDVLKTIDWTVLSIDVISIEYRILGDGNTGNGKNASLTKLGNLRSFFKETGLYKETGILPPGKEDDGLDIIFTSKRL